MTDYFSGEDVERKAGAIGSYATIDEQVAVEPAPGIVLRAIAGERLMLSHVTVAPNSEAPVHTHEEEQLGVVLTGTCRFELDGEERDLGPGDVYHAPPGVPHGVRTTDGECVLIDVFSPPRQALLGLIDGP